MDLIVVFLGEGLGARKETFWQAWVWKWVRDGRAKGGGGAFMFSFQILPIF